MLIVFEYLAYFPLKNGWEVYDIASPSVCVCPPIIFNQLVYFNETKQGEHAI
jgi:hypothetical protein